MAIELVVFDLAGTTVRDNKDVHRVLQKSLQQDGVDISIDDANLVMGIPKPVAIRALLEKRYTGDRAITEEWIDSIHKRFVAEMILFYQTDSSVGEKDGVTETFKKLKERKLKVAIDTGFDRAIANAILERLTWKAQGLIDVSVTSDEVQNGRPHADLILKAMELTGVVDPANVAKVGDTASDMQQGFAAGCSIVIGVTTGAFTREQLELEKHTHLISNITEVLTILETAS